ncbi:hypothetical protein LMH87_004303 [Akanthomyces muscarius]|uniref:Uncharacterized protein n=1 Tax=Akanthomyces muscarius TaxID=2231603 RepID=A0A9W8UHI3_AKAMU|nr:hypothetical protein LMH87_004303 [Akanthomyces muscarius]KAJ4145453.1 hypothetical protein LMH87_004303 [Akanthomyces muscarius]
MKFPLALTLASLGAAAPLAERGPSIVVGYRTVSKQQAADYKAAGNTLVYTGSQSSDQLGPGVYISPKLGEWPGPDDGWYCAILADSTPWNPTNKAWVPKTDNNGKALWWKAGETNRAAYLKQIGGSGFKPENTILLSQIEGFPLLQLLIPPQLIKNPKVLKTTTQCAAKTDTAGVKAIAAHGNVDWSKWPNVKGTPQKP